MDLKDRYSTFGDGIIFSALNRMHHYQQLTEIQLPSNTNQTFKFISPANGRISIYQLRLSSFNFTDLNEVNESCRTLFPTLKLDMEFDPVQRDTNGKIIRNEYGGAIFIASPYSQQEQKQRNCVRKYQYGDIFLKINNNSGVALFDSRVSNFGGQSFKTKKDEILHVSINSKIPKNTQIAPAHNYYIFLKTP